MREILFRGKVLFRKSANQLMDKYWVYGGIVHQTDYYGEKCDKYFIIDGTDTQDYEIGYECEVIPETVSEFTGLYDKNGQKIFEHDIVEIDGEDGYFQIVWSENEAMFRMEGDGLSVDFDNFYPYEVEVVDNIFDNPELM